MGSGIDISTALNLDPDVGANLVVAQGLERMPAPSTSRHFD